jgi:hypothetical protein
MNACPVCKLPINAADIRRKYCSTTCRKTAERRRTRFRNLHGVTLEDLIPNDGDWSSPLDESLLAQLVRHNGVAKPRSRTGRPPNQPAVRQGVRETLQPLTLRFQAEQLIGGHRRLLRQRRLAAASKASG